jgi:hypothetical protein
MTENATYNVEDDYEDTTGLRAFDEESLKLRECVLIDEESNQAKEYRPSLEEAVTRCIAVFDQVFKNVNAIEWFYDLGIYKSERLQLAYLRTLFANGSQELYRQTQKPKDYVRDGRNGGICPLLRSQYQQLVRAGFVKKHPEIPLGSPDALDTKHLQTMPVSDGPCGALEEMNIFVLKHAIEWLMYIKYLIEHKNDK